MKKLLLATAVATLSITAAQAAPTVYGKAFVTGDYQDMNTDYTNGKYYTYNAHGTTTTADDTFVASGNVRNYSTDDSKTKLNSTGSRIGLKGAEALTANTDLVYQLEYGVEVDSDNNAAEEGRSQNQFYARDTYVGVANKHYGTFVAGRLTTIDDNINYANQASGGVLGGDDVLATFTAPRVNNAFAYFSPEYSGMQFMAMYGIDSDQDVGGLANHDQYGVGVKYEPAGQAYRAGLTYITAGDALKAMRVSGDYKVNPAVTVGALYQNTDFDQNDNENAFTLSGAYKTATPWTVYAQGDVVQHAEGYKDDERNRFILGGKYAFNPATTGHIYGAYMDTKVKNLYGTHINNDGTYDLITTDKETDGFGIGAGIEYKF